MELNTKIKLLEVRDFGSDMEITFKFLKQNFGTLYKGLLPFIILVIGGGVFISFALGFTIQRGSDDAAMGGMILGYLLILISLLFVQLYPICYLWAYNNTEGEVQLSNVYRKFMKVLLPYIGGQLVFGLMVTIGYIFCVVPGIFLAIAFLFFMHVYINEDLGIIGSFQRSFELVKNNWWSTFGFMWILSMISGVVIMVFYIPFIVAAVTGSMLIMKISLILLFVGMICAYIIMFVGLGIKYYSLYAQKEGVQTYDEIDNIGRDYQG